jgi:RNA polymerase sigma-70 factor (ECF subfamily)
MASLLSKKNKKNFKPRQPPHRAAHLLNRIAKMNFFKKTYSTEADLIEGCLKQKQSAQNELYRRYSGVMLAVCIRYMGNKYDAEDMMVNGFIKVFEKVGQFGGNGSFEGWMKRIMANECLNYLRREKNVRKESDLQEYDFFDEQEDALDGISAQEVLEQIAALPDGYRTIFNLYALEGYSHKEIGEMLGIAEGTSKSQLNKARNILKNKIMALNHLSGETKGHERESI